METTRVELTLSNAVSRGPGWYRCHLEPALNLKRGDVVSLDQAFLDIPGSSRDGTGTITLAVDYEEEFTFAYYRDYRKDIATLSGWLTLPGGPSGSLAENGRYFLSGSAIYGRDNIVQEKYILRVPAGEYQPVELAQQISNNLRAVGGHVLAITPGGAPNLPGDVAKFPNGAPMFRATHNRDSTWSPHGLMVGLDESGNTVYASPTPREDISTPDVVTVSVFGCSDPTLAWDETVGRFQWKAFHDIPRGTDGSLSVYRVFWADPENRATIDLLGSQGGVSILSFGHQGDRDGFANSLWAVLGFTYDDLEVPASQGMGLTTAQALQGDQFGLGMGNGEFARFYQNHIRETIVTPAAVEVDDPTTGPYASLPPVLSAGGAPYFRVLSNIACNTATDWRATNGTETFTCIGTVTRTFAELDVYSTAQGMPMEITRDIDLGSIEIHVVDPERENTPIVLGESTAMILSVVRQTAKAKS